MPIIDFDTAEREWRRINGGKTTVKEDPRRWASYDTIRKIRQRAGASNACATCGALPGEIGLVRFNWPVGHAFFGQAVRCPACNGRVTLT